jgi:hypothetical protein
MEMILIQLVHSQQGEEVEGEEEVEEEEPLIQVKVQQLSQREELRLNPRWKLSVRMKKYKKIRRGKQHQQKLLLREVQRRER